MRVFCAFLATETNFFSPVPGDYGSFEREGILRGREAIESPRFLGPGPVAARIADAYGLKVFQSIAAMAAPSAPIVPEAYVRLKSEILGDLETCGPVDVVLLGLHGAMATQTCDDVEGDLLAAIRERVGGEAVIGAVLDPHAHLTEAMRANADILVALKEYPHTDIVEMTERMVELTLAVARGEVRPVMSVFDCRMIALCHTTREPMLGLVRKIKDIERTDPRVLSISIIHGFPYADVPDLGTKVLVVTNADAARGEALAEEIGRELFSLRGRTAAPTVDVPGAVESVRSSTVFPVVLADVADNAGGGAPSDSTFILDALIEADITKIAVGPIWDPVAIQFCLAAGEGARLNLRVGGKASSLSGRPLDFDVVVRRIARNYSQPFAGVQSLLGDSVLVSSGDIDIVLVSTRSQCFDRAMFEALGVRLTDKQAIVVKSGQHFRASFETLGVPIVYVQAPGVLGDITALRYARIRRPMWPFDPGVQLS